MKVTNHILRLYYKNGKVRRVIKTKKIPFLKVLCTINWGNSLKKVVLRISYGRHEDCWGKITHFHNEAEFLPNEKKEFWDCFSAFVGVVNPPGVPEIDYYRYYFGKNEKARERYIS